MFYKAFNENNELLAFACRVDNEIAADGQFLVRTGSASLWASRVEPLTVGEVFSWKINGKLVRIEITKINRKTVKAVVRNSGERLSFDV